MLDENPEELISLTLGNKLYEMSNHLGNVLTVINDIKVPQSSNSVDVDGYLATIVSTADYSPFGVQLDERTVSAETYRYGYQGSEKDDEVKGKGNSYTTEFRMLDPRLGRWLSIDPLAAEFPWQSPYVSMDNNPAMLNDPRGDFVPIVIGGYLLGEAAVAWLFVATSVTVVTTTHYVMNQDVYRSWAQSDPSTWSWDRGRPHDYYTGNNFRSGGITPFRPGGNNPGGDKIAKWVIGTGLGFTAIHRMYKHLNIPMPDPKELNSGIEGNRIIGSVLVPAFFIEVNITNIEERKDGKLDVTITADGVYQIQKGDNLTKIAKEFNTTVEQLCEWNNIPESEKNHIQIGNYLKVAEETVCVVAEKDEVKK